MNDKRTAVIIGVGAEQGLGATLCHSAAADGLHVVVAGRTQEKIDRVVAAIVNNGGAATAATTDTTDEAQVVSLLNTAESIAPVHLAIFNAGNNMPGDFLQMEANYFEQCWRISCFGGFLFAREALLKMVPRKDGTVLFTGASASLRGKPNFAAFTSAKAGLRTMAQSLAKEYGPQGIHVAQVFIDGGINGDRIRERLAERNVEMQADKFVGLAGLADLYMFLYHQPRNAWTHEIDVRTHLENF